MNLTNELCDWYAIFAPRRTVVNSGVPHIFAMSLFGGLHLLDGLEPAPGQAGPQVHRGRCPGPSPGGQQADGCPGPTPAQATWK